MADTTLEDVKMDEFENIVHDLFDCLFDRVTIKKRHMTII